MWGAGGSTPVGVLFAIFSSSMGGRRRRNKCQPRWICSIHSNTHSRSPPSSPRCVQQHHSIFSIQFRLTYRELPAYRQREPSPGPPLLSPLSRHCCCEDEMSVLLKVPLKHNSDLWCLIVSFQSCERGRECILTQRGHFGAVTHYRQGGGAGGGVVTTSEEQTRSTMTPCLSATILIQYTHTVEHVLAMVRCFHSV